MTEHQVLFCPFCRESFERRTTCPEHELTLLPWSQLPPETDPSPDPDELDEGPALPPEDRPLPLLSPRLGRGLVGLGAILDAVALGLPFAQLGDRSPRTFELAALLPSLWTLMLVSFCALYVLARRRTPRALQSLRVVVPLLGVISLLTLVVAYARIGLRSAPGPAVYAIALASALLVIGGARLGTLSKRA